MVVNGCDCSIVIKTFHRETDIPYAEETIREAVSFLREEAAIEGDGVCRGIAQSGGVTGCIVTPLTLGTAPLLLYLAMGAVGMPVFVSETRDVYQCRLRLVPLEDTELFVLIQDRGAERIIYERCGIKSFELRVMRDEAIKLKLDICGERPPRVYPYEREWGVGNRGAAMPHWGERFSGDYFTYQINGQEFKNIYGVTLLCKKQGSTITELWLRRVLEKGNDLPNNIEELTITAQLLRDKYEYRRYGTFRITVKRLVMVADEIDVNSADSVVGPLRYYVAGKVDTQVFTSGEEIL